MQENISELPYERFETLGPGSLTDAELIAIILRTGTKGESAVDVARKVLEMGKAPRTGLLSLFDLDLKQLSSVPGIGKVKAIKLKCLAELTLRMHEARFKSGLNIKSPSITAEFYMERLRHKKTECVMLISIDSKGLVLRESVISNGSVNRSVAPIRSIMMEALDAEAVNILLMHNHPSGDPKPSSRDVELTKKLYESGKIMEIPLLDHIIIGDNRYYSFSEAGFFEELNC